MEELREFAQGLRQFADNVAEAISSFREFVRKNDFIIGHAILLSLWFLFLAWFISFVFGIASGG